MQQKRLRRSSRSSKSWSYKREAEQENAALTRFPERVRQKSTPCSSMGRCPSNSESSVWVCAYGGFSSVSKMALYILLNKAALQNSMPNSST